MTTKNNSKTNAATPKQTKAQSEALYAAAKRGDLDACIAMMDDGVSPFIAEEHMGVHIKKMAGDDSKLYDAIHAILDAWMETQPYPAVVEFADSYDAIRALVENGADVGEARVDGFTCLHHAAIHGNEDVARFAISQGVDVNATSRDVGWWNGDTPLFLAVKFGHPTICKMLIDAGADMYDHNEHGDSVMWAFELLMDEASLTEMRAVLRVLVEASFNYATFVRRTGNNGGAFFELLEQQGLDEYADLFRSQLIEAERERLVKSMEDIPNVASETVPMRERL